MNDIKKNCAHAICLLIHACINTHTAGCATFSTHLLLLLGII